MTVDTYGSRLLQNSPQPSQNSIKNTTSESNCSPIKIYDTIEIIKLVDL